MSRILAQGSVLKLGGLLVMLHSSVAVSACQIIKGEAVAETALNSDELFAELLSHDPVNLKLNVDPISEEVDEFNAQTGKTERVRKTFNANGAPVRIVLVADVEATKKAEEEKAAAASAPAETPDVEGAVSGASVPSDVPAAPADAPDDDTSVN